MRPTQYKLLANRTSCSVVRLISSRHPCRMVWGIRKSANEALLCHRSTLLSCMLTYLLSSSVSTYITCLCQGGKRLARRRGRRGRVLSFEGEF